jgi:hypothetical protein
MITERLYSSHSNGFVHLIAIVSAVFCFVWLLRSVLGFFPPSCWLCLVGTVSFMLSTDRGNIAGMEIRETWTRACWVFCNTIISVLSFTAEGILLCDALVHTLRERGHMQNSRCRPPCPFPSQAAARPQPVAIGPRLLLLALGRIYRWPKSTRPVSPARSPLFGPGPNPAR